MIEFFARRVFCDVAGCKWSMEGRHITGSFRIRVFRPVFDEVRKLLPGTRERMELRREALKLRFWPVASPQDEQGQLLDLDWSWIRSLPGQDVGELRIHGAVGGQSNLRIIFFVGPREVVAPLPMIWILAAFAKKRDDFTRNQLKIFQSRRTLVVERVYNHRP